MRQPSRRLGKARIMMTYDPKQGNSRSCTWIKMLSEWWVSCWDCHLKLPLWCEFWCQVANEFRWNFLRVSTNILYCYFFRSLSSRLVTADGWTLWLGCGGEQLILWWSCWRTRKWHAWVVICTNCGPLVVVVGKDLAREAQTTGQTSFCWERVMPTIKRRSFFTELQCLLEVWWLKDRVWGFGCGSFWSNGEEFLHWYREAFLVYSGSQVNNIHTFQ